MANFKNINWMKIGTDLEHGFEKSMSAVKKGAFVAGKKAGELAGEGQRQYRVMVLKSKVKDVFTELGVRVYALRGRHAESPLLDEKVKEAIAKIGKYDSQIAKLEKGHSMGEKKQRTTSAKKPHKARAV